MITGSTLDSVACASTAAGGVSCTDVSAAHPLITPAISAIAINFFIVVHPLLTMRHPDKETCTKSKCVRDQSAKTSKKRFIFETYITNTTYLPSTVFRASGRSSSTKAHKQSPAKSWYWFRRTVQKKAIKEITANKDMGNRYKIAFISASLGAVRSKSRSGMNWTSTRRQLRVSKPQIGPTGWWPHYISSKTPNFGQSGPARVAPFPSPGSGLKNHDLLKLHRPNFVRFDWRRQNWPIHPPLPRCRSR